MTTIVYKDGILAADSRSISNNVHFSQYKKIYLIGEDVYGFAGDVISICQYVRLLKKEIKEFKTPEKTNFAGMRINLKTKKVFTIENNGDFICEEECLDEFFAIGIGRELAMGAMEMGASSLESCDVACKYSNCSRPFYYIDINSDKPQILEAK
jgi:20S proteasome alpha/beta subunit